MSRRKLSGGAAAGGAAIALAAVFVFASAAFSGVSESDVPSTSIVPGDTGGGPSTPPAPEGTGSPPPSPAAAAAVPAPRPPSKTATHKLSAKDKAVEPADAVLQLKTDTWAFSEPTKWSKHVERVHAGKFLKVTGSTRYYLQVKLKSGQTAYVDPQSVTLAKPTDKIFLLTSDASVLDKPNRWGKKVSQVHKGFNVHAVGIALNYVQIKMKSGLQGYIPVTALQ
ncbi:MAG TPA: hypothetical protein VIX12_05530 [Candidatus Binataceae bacterium]